MKQQITLVLASRNAGKIRELHTLLAQSLPGVRVLSLDDVGITGEIEENGTSFAENALCKARAAAKSGYIGVGDDSGLTVDALGGAPGIYSARYAGTHGADAANNALLLRNLENVGERTAHFVCCIACVFPDGESFTAEGITDGSILYVPQGTDGFGYDPLFFCPETGKTFASMTQEEKNAVSHRGKAIRLFADRLAQRLEKEQE